MYITQNKKILLIKVYKWLRQKRKSQWNFIKINECTIKECKMPLIAYSKII